MRYKIKKTIIFLIMISFIINGICFKVDAITNDKKNSVFKRITVDDGLSQTTAQYLFQDSKGYMWIGTGDGLNKYNGHEFEVYRYRDGSNKSISSNYISAINEDEEGNIWVGTESGINKIDSETNIVKTYSAGSNGCSLSDNNITEILIDSNNDIFVATTNGLNLYDKEKDDFIRVYEDKENNNKLSRQIIYSKTMD